MSMVHQVGGRRPCAEGLPKIIEDIAAFDKAPLLNRGNCRHKVLKLKRDNRGNRLVVKIL